MKDAGQRAANQEVKGNSPSQSSLSHKAGHGFKTQRRRNRRVKVGRDWICIYCENAYFRSKSLVFHVRQKHTDEATSRQFIASQLQRAGRRPDTQEGQADRSVDAAQRAIVERRTLVERPEVAGGPTEPLFRF